LFRVCIAEISGSRCAGYKPQWPIEAAFVRLSRFEVCVWTYNVEFETHDGGCGEDRLLEMLGTSSHPYTKDVDVFATVFVIDYR
jgi:hypothetical protein